MDDLIDVTIPIDAEAAKKLDTPARREAFGRYVSGLLKGGRPADRLVDAIAELKKEARANGLTDDQIDAELAAYNAERRGGGTDD